MALSGNLQDVALPDILQLLAAQGKDGVLTLSRGEESVRISIAEGMAVHADSNQRSLHQRLGRMLVGAGKLATADLRRALAVQKERGGRLGEVLVAEARLSPDDLRRALNLQFLQIIYGVLRWDDGSYDFERCAITVEHGDIEPVSFQSILMDGMRMIDEWPLIEKRFANRQVILQRIPREESATTAAGADLGLEDLEAEVYERVDGKSSIQQIIDRSMRLEFDVCRVLYDLGERGLVGPAYEGQLGETDFPDLLLAVLSAKASGRLELSRGMSLKTVTFCHGEIAGADSSDPDDGIGPFLLKRGAIGRRDLEQTQAAAPEDLGEELVRCGALERERLDSHLGEHATELILSLFPWTEGTYRFRPGVPAAVLAALAGRTTAIILRGIQATDRWSRIARAAGPLETVYRRCGAAGPGPWDALPDEHRQILDLFAGGLSVREACERGEVPEHFLHQLIWAGRVLGLLEGPPLPDGVRLLISALSGHPAEPAEEFDEVLLEAEEQVKPKVPPRAERKVEAKVEAKVVARAEESPGQFDLAGLARALGGGMPACFSGRDEALAESDDLIDGPDLDAADLMPDLGLLEPEPAPTG
jgi:hypothetical protein